MAMSSQYSARTIPLLAAACLLEFVIEHGTIVTSIEYRLSPEYTFLSAVEVCYPGLIWVSMHAEELGIDIKWIIINGLSAGGGLVTSAALMCRDRNATPPLLG
ncbi:hypothetical protein BJX99DRAFT_253994 [Aspergillus californicus]